MTLSSEKEMAACHWPASGLPLSGCILALNGIVDGNKAPCLLPSFFIHLIILRSYFCSHSNTLYCSLSPFSSNNQLPINF